MRLTPIIRVGISLGVVALILRRVPAGALWAAIQHLNGTWLWAALATALATLAIRTVKWQQLLQASGTGTSWHDAMRSLCGGFALGVVTPGRLGELGRCFFFPKSERGSVIPLNLLDRFLDSWSVATFAVASIFLAGWNQAGIIAMAIWLAVLPILLELPRLVSLLQDRPWWGKILGPQLRNAGPSLAKIAVAPFAGWALLSTSLDILTFYFILRAFHPTGIATAPATYPWIVMASGIPLSLGGLGLREGAATLLLSHYAITAAVATDAALLLFAFLSLLPALCGGILLLLARPENCVKHAGFGRLMQRGMPENFRLNEKQPSQVSWLEVD